MRRRKLVSIIHMKKQEIESKKKAANGAWVANMSCALRKAAEFLWIRFFALQLIQGWSRRENGS